jgi:tetratricopeptide (TPR) repeat protein
MAPSTLRRWWLAPLVALATWRILSLGLADHYADERPERALRWRPDHPQALIRAAEHALDKLGDLDRASALARRAATANPLDGRPYRILGAVAEQRGDSARAARLYTLAVRHSPRDLPSLAWLMRHQLLAGHVDEGLTYLDAQLRVRPSLATTLFPTLIAALDASGGQLPVAATLASHPPWRTDFLAHLASDARSADAISAVFEQLAATPGGLAKNERSAYVERLIRDRRWQQARRVWTAGLPAEQRPTDELVFNGGFEQPAGGDGFDWRVDRIPGASVELLAGPGVSGSRALYVEFHNRRVPFAHVRQLLTLAPGHYRLTARYRLDGLRNERGLTWTLLCAESPSVRLGSSQRLTGSSPWSTLELDFDVPTEHCGAQWLRLELAARIPAETQIDGRAWFDDVAIQPLPPPREDTVLHTD